MRLERAKSAVIAPTSQISSSDRPASRAASRSSALKVGRVDREGERQVDDGALRGR